MSTDALREYAAEARSTDVFGRVAVSARHRGALTLGTRVRFPLAQHTRRGSPPHGTPEIVK